MHVLVAHLPTFIKDHGNICMFSQQGLEKLNDDITKDYIKSTNNKSSEDSLRQILFKPNRLEHLTSASKPSTHMFVQSVRKWITTVEPALQIIHKDYKV